MLLVITGKKQSGKDTLAKYLNIKHNFEICPPLASPFKKSACEWFGWDERHTEGELKEVVDPNWGFSPRRFFQVFGNEIMKKDLGEYFPQYKETVGDNIWINIFINWYKKQDPTKNHVVSDMRCWEEYHKFVKLSDVVFVRTVSDRSPHDSHGTEQQINKFPVDYHIVNNGYGTFFQYYQDIDRLMDIMREDGVFNG